MLRNLIFPNGICMAHDGVSFMFAETWGCRVSRYYFDGPKAGTVEPVIPNLPGYPDNINRASDGTYWLALVGMRTPSLDLALKMPGFRRRMARRMAPDEWLYPNINTGCVLRFDDEGRILEALWDLGGENHPMITSMREHKGHLYIGGILNNRIGKLQLRGRRSQLDRPSVLLGAAHDRSPSPGSSTRFSGAARARSPSRALDGALRPNRRLDEASDRIPISRPSGIIAGPEGAAGQRGR